MSLQIRINNHSLYNRHLQCLADVIESYKLWNLACSMAWLDIKLRYKGSLLGPFWMTSTSAVMIVAVGVIYGSLFKINTQVYLPYLSISFILWQNAISSMIVDSCQCFLQTDTFIRSLKLPFFLQAIRTVIRNCIMTALNSIIPFVVFIYYHRWPGSIILLTIPGICLWIINSHAICLLLGSVCTRFRDIPQIINSFIQIIYYITPIMWMPSQIQNHKTLLLTNPIYCTIQLIQGPILGEHLSIYVITGAILYSFILWIIAWVTFLRSRSRLAFWI